MNAPEISAGISNGLRNNRHHTHLVKLRGELGHRLYHGFGALSQPLTNFPLVTEFSVNCKDSTDLN